MLYECTENADLRLHGFFLHRHVRAPAERTCMNKLFLVSNNIYTMLLVSVGYKRGLEK